MVVNSKAALCPAEMAWMVGQNQPSIDFVRDAEEMLEMPHTSHERRVALLQAILDIKSKKLRLTEPIAPGAFCEKLGIA